MKANLRETHLVRSFMLHFIHSPFLPQKHRFVRSLMERAARLIQNNKLSKKVFSEEDLTRAVWPAAVGKAIAGHTLRLTLVRTTLVVEVEDAIWQRQLFTLRGQILERLRRVTGSSELVQDLEFRTAPKRRQPQRAESRQSPATQADLPYDEADSIQDAVLKKVYRLSRKKATA
jgi:hypothetical protein